jgi:hypothetical protein
MSILQAFGVKQDQLFGLLKVKLVEKFLQIEHSLKSKS